MATINSSMIFYLSPKVSVSKYNIKGEEDGQIELPDVFRMPVRRDLILRAFLSEFTASIQPKARDPMAGKRTTARSIGIGHGVARVPRIKGGMRAAFAPMVRKGRAAFPPRLDEKIYEDINKKEKRLAIMSSLAATAILDLVKERGHEFDAKTVPLVISSDVLNEIKKTKDAKEFLTKIGVYKDIERASERIKVRAGKGKMRGRTYKGVKSILFIVEDYKSPFARAVINMPGVDVVKPEIVSVMHLSPGGVPGRLTVITTEALNYLGKRFSLGD
ncbi:MAG: 50S ribosomal protein L4 [Caldisphaera sp.]|jgi:large subunit ribosomal protein L4e|uniref:50S ribosomal protein L4 n=1 Tax=Caldisphaera sp. TaxID=2060322 RepID=UPI000CB4F36E|nr:MAG: 50S ribosomal protein L4 [Caldisphaera sp.]